MDNDRDTAKTKTPSLLVIGVALILVAVVADIVDVICFQIFLRGNGVGLLQKVPWALTWQYLTTFPGHVLTFLGIAPYVFVIGAMKFMAWNVRE